MRRKKQELSFEDSIIILKEATSGVLAVLGDDNYPYAVPLSFVYDNGKIYFHCAREGHKLDAILRNNKVTFCIIAQDQVIPEKYTTYFRSVILFGKARILDNPKEKRDALEKLAKKYSSDKMKKIKEEIEKQFERVYMVEINIEHITGKEAIELVRDKEEY